MATVSPYRESPAVKEFTVGISKRLTFNELAAYGVYKEKLFAVREKMKRGTHNGWMSDVDESIATLERIKIEGCHRVRLQCTHVNFDTEDEVQRTCIDCESIVQMIKELTFDDITEMLNSCKSSTTESGLVPVVITPTSRAKEIVVYLITFAVGLVAYYVTERYK